MSKSEMFILSVESIAFVFALIAAFCHIDSLMAISVCASLTAGVAGLIAWRK